jgi:hypothetical protein
VIRGLVLGLGPSVDRGPDQRGMPPFDLDRPCQSDGPGCLRARSARRWPAPAPAEEFAGDARRAFPNLVFDGDGTRSKRSWRGTHRGT